MSGQPLSGQEGKKGPRAGRRPARSKVFANRAPILDGSTRTQAYQIDFVEIVKTENNGKPSRPSGRSVSTFLDTQTPHTLASGRTAFMRADTQAARRLLTRPEWKDSVVFDIEVPGPEKEEGLELLELLAREKAHFCVSGPALDEQARSFFSPNCFVKIDIAGREEGELEETLAGLAGLPVRTVATSVGTQEDFQMCSRVGFDLFGGDFFRKAPAATKKSVSPNHALLLDLSARIAREEDIGTIEEIFKKSPDLTFGLFNLVRSAYFRASNDLTSIRQAITLLGYKDLLKWASLMLFTISHIDPSVNPLFENALVRARTMELAARSQRRKGLSDAAYMTGIFSLVPALFGVPTEQIVESANLGEEIREALSKGTGRLGAMLEIVREIEEASYEQCTRRIEEAGISLDHFFAARSTAFSEFSALTRTANGDTVEGGTSPPPVAGRISSSPGPPGSDTLPRESWFRKVCTFFHHQRPG